MEPSYTIVTPYVLGMSSWYSIRASCMRTDIWDSICASAMHTHIWDSICVSRTHNIMLRLWHIKRTSWWVRATYIKSVCISTLSHMPLRPRLSLLTSTWITSFLNDVDLLRRNRCMYTWICALKHIFIDMRVKEWHLTCFDAIAACIHGHVPSNTYTRTCALKHIYMDIRVKTRTMDKGRGPARCRSQCRTCTLPLPICMYPHDCVYPYVWCM